MMEIKNVDENTNNQQEDLNTNHQTEIKQNGIEEDIQIIQNMQNEQINNNTPMQHKKEIHTNPVSDTKSFILSAGDQNLISRTKQNKQMDLQNFFKKSRHFFIMTDGGKPIYSRYGDEVG